MVLHWSFTGSLNERANKASGGRGNTFAASSGSPDSSFVAVPPPCHSQLDTPWKTLVATVLAIAELFRSTWLQNSTQSAEATIYGFRVRCSSPSVAHSALEIRSVGSQCARIQSALEIRSVSSQCSTAAIYLHLMLERLMLRDQWRRAHSQHRQPLRRFAVRNLMLHPSTECRCSWRRSKCPA